jgi:hypothetical protein
VSIDSFLFEHFFCMMSLEHLRIMTSDVFLCGYGTEASYLNKLFCCADKHAL